jgi:hypothetical protein
MPVEMKYDKKSKAVAVAITFDAPDQVLKEGLEDSVIANHLLTHAAALCSQAASAAMTSKDAAAIDAETAEAKAKIDASAASEKAAIPSVEIKS